MSLTGKKTVITVVVVILFCTAIVSVIGGMRDRLHIDEVWTYGLSNNHDSPFFYDYVYGVGDSILQERSEFNYHNEQDYKNYFYHWHTSDFYREYLTVQEDERFDYANVFENQTEDTHPPLYYCVIHTICSLFPNSFSFQYGLIPNYVFYACSLLLLFLIARKLLKSDFSAILSMLLWGLSRAGITEVLFIRMYMMSSMLALCLIYTDMKLNEKYRWPLVLVTSLINIAGFLTHYYYYIIAFYLTLFTCVYYLLKKQYKKMFGYGLAALASVGISVAIFPATLRHLLKGTYSDLTVASIKLRLNIFHNLFSFIDQTVSYYCGIEMSSAIIFNVAVLLLVICLFYKFIKYYQRDRKTGKTDEMLIKEYFGKAKGKIASCLMRCKSGYSVPTAIVIAVFATGITIIKLEPNMEEYTVRYIFVVLPMLSLVIVFLLERIIRKVNSKISSVKIPQAVLALFVAVLIIGSNVLQGQTLLKLNRESIVVPFNGEKAIVVNIESYRDHSFSYMYLDADMIYPMDRLDSRIDGALSSLNDGDSALLIVHSELASVDEIDGFLNKTAGITYSYLATSYYPLEINDMYHVYEITINSNNS